MALLGRRAHILLGIRTTSPESARNRPAPACEEETMISKDGKAFLTGVAAVLIGEIVSLVFLHYALLRPVMITFYPWGK
jgi:hypothetical protein